MTHAIRDSRTSDATSMIMLPTTISAARSARDMPTLENMRTTSTSDVRRVIN